MLLNSIFKLNIPIWRAHCHSKCNVCYVLILSILYLFFLSQMIAATNLLCCIPDQHTMSWLSLPVWWWIFWSSLTAFLLLLSGLAHILHNSPAVVFHFWSRSSEICVWLLRWLLSGFYPVHIQFYVLLQFFTIIQTNKAKNWKVSNEVVSFNLSMLF